MVLMARYYARPLLTKGRVILANSLLSAWRSYRSRRGIVHELITLAAGLVAGLLLLPAAIYFVGQALLGGYLRSARDTASSGPLTLWADFVAGLRDGSLAHWIVLLAPYVTYLLWKFGRKFVRA
jgi:hypothetical protein